jgi:deazaflavin-dependent oxidoreductase (nitroreductase family)
VTTALDPRIAEVLTRGETIDITTIGRTTGQPRTVELVYHAIDGRVVISGHPGRPRSWLANLRNDPHFTFHLKRSVRADLPAVARIITDRAEREELLRPIARLWRIDHGLMVRSAPLIEVTFPEG